MNNYILNKTKLTQQFDVKILLASSCITGNNEASIYKRIVLKKAFILHQPVERFRSQRHISK